MLSLVYEREISIEGIRPQPNAIDCESILMREENQSIRRKTLGVRLRSIETQHTYDPRPGLSPGNSGGRHG